MGAEPNPRELEALTTLALMDADAAAAYAAAAVGDYTLPHGQEPVRRQLEAFRADHLRHLTDLNARIAQAGGPAVAPAAEPALLQRLAMLAGQVSAEAALLELLGIEELTNSGYDVAMALDVDADTRALLERSFADEQRHLAWLHDAAHDIFDGEDDDDGTDDAEEGARGAIEVVSPNEE